MLSERIETILRETGTKIGALGEVAGVSSGTASMWLLVLADHPPRKVGSVLKTDPEAQSSRDGDREGKK